MTKKMNRIPLSKIVKQKLKDPEFRFYFEQEQATSQIAHMVRNARLKAGLSQAALAKRAQTTQAAIARLESGLDSRIPSLGLIARIAKALRAQLQISFDYAAAA